MKPQTPPQTPPQQAPPGQAPSATGLDERDPSGRAPTRGAEAHWQPGEPAASPECESAWLDQAAALAAQALELPVALLRLRDDDEWLQGLHGDAEAGACRALLRAAQQPPAPAPAGTGATGLGLCEHEALYD